MGYKIFGTSEKFLGEFIAQDRNHIVLATKYTGTMWGRDVNASGNSRKNMTASVQASLKRLNTVSAITPGFPHNMLAREAEARKKKILNHREWYTG